MKGNSNNKAAASNIKVAVRVRPVLPDETAKGLSFDKTKLVLDNRMVKIYNEKHSTYKNYKFDQCFDESSDQSQVFRRARIDYLIKQVVEGFHATIFVYGQTGSGKTHTMEGYRYEPSAQNSTILIPKILKPTEIEQNTDPYSLNLTDEGLIPRSIRNLFQQVNQRKEATNNSNIAIQVQYVQLYNEKVYDLLNSQAIRVMGKQSLNGIPGLKIKWNPASDDVIVENAFVFECHSPEDALKYFWKGLKNKMMASHAMNNQSSRSHCILTFTVTQIDPKTSENSIVSKLQLVDLAGSERQSATQGFGGGGLDQVFQKEAIEINKSLFTLRQVISALESNSNFGSSLNNQQYVPYRESKLTTLLRQSLGGNSYCLMVACLSPLDLYYEENISTLQYASKATGIANRPKINVDPKVRTIMDQKSMIEKLTAELRRANDQIRFLTSGGCQCKVQNDPTANLNQITGPATNIARQQAQDIMKSSSNDGTGVTINNNFNQSTIRIINGDQQNQTTIQEGKKESLQLNGQAQSQANFVPQSQDKQTVVPKLPQTKLRNQSRISSRTKTESSSGQLNSKQQPGESHDSKSVLSANQKNQTTRLPSGIGARSMASDLVKQSPEADQGQINKSEKFPQLVQKTERRGMTPGRNNSLAKTQNVQTQQATSNTYLLAKQQQHQEKMKQHQQRMAQHAEQASVASQEFGTSRKMLMNTTSMTSMSDVKFLSMHDQMKQKSGSQFSAGMMSASSLSQGDGLHGISQDKMIHSIGIVKEILQSNMLLREDLLNLTQEQQMTSTENFQLNIENEDLRDRLNLLSNNAGVSISYNNYLPGVDIQNVLTNVLCQNQQSEQKSQLFDYIFSMKKDNRNLLKRIQSFEKDEQERRQRAKIIEAQENQQWQDSQTNLTMAVNHSTSQQLQSTYSYQARQAQNQLMTKISLPPPTPPKMFSQPSSTGGESTSQQQKLLRKLQQQKKRPSRTQMGNYQEESVKAEERTLRSAYNPDMEINKRNPSANGRKSRQENSQKIPTRVTQGNKSRPLRESASSVDAKIWNQKAQKTSLLQSPDKRSLRINTIHEEEDADNIKFYDQPPNKNQISPSEASPMVCRTGQNTVNKGRSSMEKIRAEAIRNSIQSDLITSFK